jgi:hypothetical protein
MTHQRFAVEQIPDFDDLKRAYANSAACNDALYMRFEATTWSIPLLAEHRRHIEQNKLRYGDAAFQTPWASLIVAPQRRFGKFNALEVGVFKGQIISLSGLCLENSSPATLASLRFPP